MELSQPHSVRKETHRYLLSWYFFIIPTLFPKRMQGSFR
jgi:hypothetical protein